VEQVAWRHLPRPRAWPVFGVEELARILYEAGLAVPEIHGLYGPWCVLGKQISMWAGVSWHRRLAVAPLMGLIRTSRVGLTRDPRKPSYALRAVASAR
jgi:hypothetical protein